MQFTGRFASLPVPGWLSAAAFTVFLITPVKPLRKGLQSGCRQPQRVWEAGVEGGFGQCVLYCKKQCFEL